MRRPWGLFWYWRAAQRTQGQWQFETIELGGRLSSLRLGLSEQPLVAYDALTPNHRLRFASRDTEWATETADPANGNDFLSLALDSGGTPHIAYVDADTNTLNYASRVGPDDWAVKVIDASPIFHGCSLQIDRNNIAHVAYVDIANQVLKYAVGSAN